VKHWTRYLNWQDLPKLWTVSILLGLTALYVVVFFSVYPSSWPEIAASIAISVMAAGWVYGLRGGLLGALLLGVFLNTLLVNLAGFDPGGWDVLIHTGGFPGTFAILLIGLAIGSLSDLVNNLETKVAERTEALRQNKELFSGILDSIEDAVWSISLNDYVLLYLSPGAIEQVKGDGGRNVLGVGHSDPGSGSDVIHKDPCQTGGTSGRYPRFRKDGETRGKLKDGGAGRRLASLFERDHGVAHVGPRGAVEFSLKGPVGINLVSKGGAGHSFQLHLQGQAVIIEQLDLPDDLSGARIHQDQLSGEP
jgi:PAS domain-containing protein